MAYRVSTLNVRPGPGPIDGGPNQLSGWTDSVGAVLSPITNFLGAGQRATDENTMLKMQNADLQAALAQHSGPSLTDLAILGGLGYLAYRLLMK